MEKARFEENLSIETDVPEQVNCSIPCFILQPLVENAVRYGADRTGLRTVAIRVRQTPAGIEIEVADHGPGMPEYIAAVSYTHLFWQMLCNTTGFGDPEAYCAYYYHCGE